MPPRSEVVAFYDVPNYYFDDVRRFDEGSSRFNEYDDESSSSPEWIIRDPTVIESTTIRTGTLIAYDSSYRIRNVMLIDPQCDTISSFHPSANNTNTPITNGERMADPTRRRQQNEDNNPYLVSPSKILCFLTPFTFGFLMFALFLQHQAYPILHDNIIEPGTVHHPQNDYHPNSANARLETKISIEALRRSRGRPYSSSNRCFSTMDIHDTTLVFNVQV